MDLNISTELKIEEITLNKHGDKIFVSPEDSALFDNYVKCFDFIVKKSKSKQEEIKEIEKKYEGKEDVESEIEMVVELSRANVEFSNNGIKEIDGIFGEGTVKKYFRDHYEKIPSFLPGVDCFMDFFNQMSPIMEQIFGKLMKEREEESKNRMAKYQPQDYNRKGGK